MLLLNDTVTSDMLHRCDETLLTTAVRRQTKRRLSMRPPKQPKKKVNRKVKAAKN